MPARFGASGLRAQYAFPDDAREVGRGSPAGYITFQSLGGCVEPYLVTVLEAISQGLFCPVDAHGNTIHLVCVDPFGEGLSRKPEDTHRW
jgi:hypothetical protein